MAYIIIFFYFSILGSFEIQGQSFAEHWFGWVSSSVAGKASFGVVGNLLVDRCYNHCYKIDSLEDTQLVDDR